jgi:thiopeptide-type bacteriocin biosynthesis protein
VASPSLLAALDRAERGGAVPDRLAGKLLRYLIRMSTRATPFGLFAGVGVARWADRTELAVVGPPRTRTRLDMEWLLGLVLRLEADPGLRRHLRLVANSAAFERNGRIHLSERAPTLGTSGAAGSVSVRATRAVRHALAAARSPIRYAELAAGALEAVPGATPALVDQLLDQLWVATLLLTDLRPPLTTADPAGWVARRLREAADAGDPADAGVALAREQATRLARLAADAAALDRVGPAEAAAGRARLAERDGTVSEMSARNRPTQAPATKAGATHLGARSLLQVDAALELRGGVHPAVGEVVAEAAGLLLGMTPLPGGPPHLAGYRRAFLRRYGPDRAVPLLELLDPRFGLGPLGPTTGLPAGGGGRRNQLLLDLACRALRERQLVLDLDDELVGRLATWDPDPVAAPGSLELYVGVAAADVAAIDRGDFSVVVAHGPGVSPAGRSMGRFGDLLAPADRTAVAAGRTAGRPGVVVAELVYLPRRLRQANVSVRPAVHGHELVVGTSPGVPAERVVPLDELVVGVRDGRLRLWWPAGRAEVEVATGHLLSPGEAPAVCRFLAEVGRDGRAQLGGFSWGPAAGFPFLPRVQAGRVVLRPASWRLDPATPPDRSRAGLRRWRDDWGAPRHVQLGGGDRRLLLDLDDPAQAGQVHQELERGRPVILSEALPGPDSAWLPGPAGHHLCELVVPLVLATAPPSPGRPEGNGRATAAPPAGARQARLRAPGSDWLYLKLYGPREDEDELLAGPVRELAEAAVGDGLAAGWHFLRYGDPDPHLRLRFRGAPERLTGELLGRLGAWAGGLVAAGGLERLAVDTYERELERYGGPDGAAAAEDLFAADSRCVAALLAGLRRGPALDRVDLAVLTVDDLLDALGLDPGRRLGWYGRRVADRRAAGPEHRRRKAALRPLLADPARLASSPGGGEVLDLLAGRRTAAVAVAGRLARLDAAGRLQGRSLEELAASFAHLHCNRLLGPDPAAERLVLGLGLRTRESLDRAPLAPAR